jgi:hypothetical protein
MIKETTLTTINDLVAGKIRRVVRVTGNRGNRG